VRVTVLRNRRTAEVSRPLAAGPAFGPIAWGESAGSEG